MVKIIRAFTFGGGGGYVDVVDGCSFSRALSWVCSRHSREVLSAACTRREENCQCFSRCSVFTLGVKGVVGVGVGVGVGS